MAVIPVTVLSHVLKAVADETFSESLDLTKDRIEELLQRKELNEFLDHYDRRFLESYDSEITFNNVDMNAVICKRDIITQSSHKQLSLKHLLDKDFKSYLPLIMQQLTFSPAYDSLWIQ